MAGRHRFLAVAALAGVAGPTAVAATALPSSVAAARLGDPAPAEHRTLIELAAGECPGLQAPVLAAQLEAESGWDPAAVSPAGALGIAQFMPGTWAAWGVDGDGDGVASPFAPADAIPAQGRFMCHLLGLAQNSGLAGDPVELALAGYNAGWGAVLAHGGVPPYAETRAYVARITATADRFRGDQRFGAADGSGFAGLPRANPHSVAEAVAWARAAAEGPPVWHRRCLSFVAQAYGWSYSGTGHALDHYRVRMPAGMRRDGDRTPPPGALMFWDTGSRSGHVALYLGGGMIASSDAGGHGVVGIVPASYVEDRWGAVYVGWAPPYFPGGG